MRGWPEVRRLLLGRFAMRLIAVVTVLAFGCATARRPEPVLLASPQPAARIALAEPELELWMEGTKPIDPQESARTLEQSRKALSEALDGRGLDVSDPEELLVVRARAIARTSERRSAQIWSAVGIVVVVVGIVVAVVLGSRSKSSSGGSRGSRAAVPVGTTRGAGVPRAARFVPRPYLPPPPIGVSLGFNVFVPVGPVVASAPIPYVEPAEARLASRGWFDGDEVELTIELAHPTTGAVTWHRTIREGIDPRDAGALSALVDRALAGQPFGQKQKAPPAPPAEAASRRADG